MVSIRRRKLLALSSGRNSFLLPLPRFENGHAPENRMRNVKPVTVRPMPSADVEEPKEERTFQLSLVYTNPNGSSSSKEQPNHQFPEVKRRKRHRRKHFENQEPVIMRGVYFKNMKWQAAIKVDKKQIHLGTVGSQEEAARLYDRAAFMCGREPNFELTDEQKHDLRKLKWEEFLAITRSAITSKKHQRRSGAGFGKKLEASTHSSDYEADQVGNGFSASEDLEISFS